MMVLTPDLAEYSNLFEIARWQAQHNPNRIALTFLPNGEAEADNLTFGQLDERARALAAHLQQIAQPGDRAILLYPSSLDAIIGLYACFYAGVIAVFTSIPHPKSRLQTLQATVAQSRASLILTTTALFATIQDQVNQSDLKSICWLETDKISGNDEAERWQPPTLSRNAPAFLLFTSGSTSTPKGVMISHGGIINEMATIGHHLNIHPESVSVSWAPLYHIGGILLPLIMTGSGMRFVFMPPQSFLESPMRWLKALSDYRGNISSSFNFGLQISVARTSPEERATLDLKAVENLIVGGERLRAEIIEDFIQTFSPCGLQRGAIRAGYGLTESIGFAAIGNPHPAGYKKFYLGLDAAGQNKAVVVEPEEKKGRYEVGCGEDIPQKRIVIANPQTLTTCPAGEMGEIWIASENIAIGYWDRPDETREIFQAYLADTHAGPFFRTGDIGCKIDNNLIINGRIKEMIILHGKNYFSQDLEKTVETAHAKLIPGSVAAFPITVNNEERLAVACEIKGEISAPEQTTIINAVRSSIAKDQQQTAYLVALVKAGALPRSASGKLLRFACHAALDAGELDVITIDRLDDAEPKSAEEDSGYVAPRSAVERALVGIWGSVLGKTRIGVNDNFFDLGGDSLLGSQILAQVQDVFLIELPAHLLFEIVTIAGMARVIDETRKKAAAVQGGMGG